MHELLIIKPSSLGDIIHGLLVAESVKRQTRQVRVSWVVSTVFAPLVEQCLTVDGKLFRFDRKAGFRGLMQVMGELRSSSFDMVWDMQGLARSGLMLAASRAPRKVARKDAREFSGWAANERIELPPNRYVAHAVEILAPFMNTLSLKPEVISRIHFENTKPPIGSVDTESLQLSIGLFPESRRREKEWPFFKQLTYRILDELPGLKVVWLGNSPQPLPKRLVREEYFRDLRGQTRLSHLPSVISACSLTVCNDSGPLHLSAALGRPTLGLFGPTDPRQYGPWPMDNVNSRVLRAPEGDLARLGVDTVFSAVQKMLG